MKKIVKSVAITALAIGVVTAAHADSFSNVSTATADLTFSQPVGALNINITPVTGLTAGTVDSLTVLATAVISSATSALHSFRWTPGTFTPSADSDTNPAPFAIISGNNNNANKLEMFVATTSSDASLKTVGGDTYTVINNPGTSTNLVIEARGEQQVAADTYTVSLDAAIYNP